MTDRRRFTGAQRLQFLWSFAVIAFALLAGLVVGRDGPVSRPAILIGCVVVWFVGQFLIGVRERRHWNAMVESSSFQRLSGTQPGDLERIVRGRSVVVSTRLSGVLSQARTVVGTSVDGVEASFTVRIASRSIADSPDGITTGNDVLDERFVIEGRQGNVEKLLSTDVQRALMDVETVGRCSITGDRVEYVVPFTRLSAEELDTIADTVVTLAERLEAVAAAQSAESGAGRT